MPSSQRSFLSFLYGRLEKVERRPLLLWRPELQVTCLTLDLPESEIRVKSGKVYLVGAGPGDPGLITVKGLVPAVAPELVI